MNRQELKMLWRERRKGLDDMLEGKQDSYATKGDALINFKRAGAYMETSPERALLGMVAKHIVAVKENIDRLEAGEDVSRIEWMEKTIDIQVYMFLLFALTEERRTGGSVSVKNDESSR